MAKLLDLPRELREQIWVSVCQQGGTPPAFAFGLLSTCRKMSVELAPYLYESVAIYLCCPCDIIQWAKLVGTFNSSCVHHLILAYSDLGKKDLADRLDLWSSALTLMSSLDNVMFYYEPKQWFSSPIWPVALAKLYIETDVKVSLKQPLGVFNIINNDRDFITGQNRGRRHFTHAAMAIHEPMPQINTLSAIKLLELNPALTLEENVTRVPKGFLADHGLHPSSTYAMTEFPQIQSVTLTYSKQNFSVPKVNANLQMMTRNLLYLVYLRLGCPELDSSFLTLLPSHIQTLDVAFHDPNPERVAQNLRRMREHCQKLFVLAISVSPLHDAYRLPDGGRAINQQSVGKTDISQWEPFWEALRFVQSTGVKVWEGDGPGSKK